MRVVRRLEAAVLWIVASLLGVVSLVLCLTIVLLPLGIPLLLLTRRLFRLAVRLWMPRGVSHPVDELGKSVRKKGRGARKSRAATSVGDAGETTRRRLRKGARRTRKRLHR